MCVVRVPALYGAMLTLLRQVLALIMVIILYLAYVGQSAALSSTDAHACAQIWYSLSYVPYARALVSNMFKKLF